MHRANELKASTVLKLISDVDGLRQPGRFEEFLLACEADMRGRTGFEDRPYPQAERFRIALRAAREVDARKVQRERGVEGEALGKALQEERLAAIKMALPPMER